MHDDNNGDPAKGLVVGTLYAAGFWFVLYGLYRLFVWTP